MLILIFAGRNSLREGKKFDFKKEPLVSVIIPAYNEEGKIKHTINSLKKVRYDNIEFIIVNDGSKDGTSREVRQYIKGNPKFFFIDRKENKGKAASLNDGIAKARGEYVGTMDADSVIEPGIFYKTVPYFKDPKVAAVTVSVLVKNPSSFLNKVFELEYVIGLSLMLKVFSFFNGVFVTPGPFSIYRKSVLQGIGGFDPNSITEDMEIAYRIQKHHYKIAMCMEAKVHTILPPSFKKITIQRRRWYSGAILTLAKHRDMLLNKKHGVFGFVVFFNYLLILLGLILFISSLYLGASNVVKDVLHLRYSSFDLISRIKSIEIDFLMLSRASVLGILSLLFTLFVLLTGLVITRTNITKRKIGIIGYIVMFFLYQYFWFISIIKVIGGKKIKWR
jgi:cellulose synthase/poly-beta-1,6-N-acetylglucosamine synthase-like glycosyltransferase